MPQEQPTIEEMMQKREDSTAPSGREGERERRNPTAVLREHRRMYGGERAYLIVNICSMTILSCPQQFCQPSTRTYFLFHDNQGQMG